MQDQATSAAAAAPSAAPAASAPGAAVPDGFERVDAAPEMQSGEALLVEAYAFIWVVLFGLVFFTWLRQRGLDARMNELEVSIARARTAASTARAARTTGAAGEASAGADEAG